MQWIWNSQDPNPGFSDWIQSEGRIFWIYGKPGAGKSTLMKQLTETEETINLLPKKPGPIIAVSYYFFELGEPQEQRFQSLLQAILCGLLESFHDTDHKALSSMMGILQPRLGLHLGDEKRSTWEVRRLKEALYQTLAACQNTARVILFVDGMDECEGDHREQLDFLRDWIESSTKSKLSIKACIASRDELDIRLRLSAYPSLAVHRFTRANIQAYVTRRLETAWKLMAAQPDCTAVKYDQTLIYDVVQKAEGVFLWVNLVVTQLEISIEQDAEGLELRWQLYDLPEGLEDLYARILAKIPQDSVHHAVNFIGLYDHNIGGMRSGILPRPRTLWEFCAAAQDPCTAISCKANFEDGFQEENTVSPREQCTSMKRRLRRICRGLIHVEDAEDPRRAEVSLVHRTVKEIIIEDVFHQMVESVDQGLFRHPEASLAAMALRLLKIDSDYKPIWVSWSSVESRQSTSQREREEKDSAVLETHSGDTEIMCFFFDAIEAAAKSTGFSHTPYIDELDRVLSHLCQDWTSKYYRSQQHHVRAEWGTDVLSLAVAHGLTVYVKEQFRINGKSLLNKTKRPLLFYPFDDQNWAHDTEECEIIDVLLRNGADPNERYESIEDGIEPITPWIYAVSVGKDRYVQGWLIDWSQKLFKYGADPTQRVFRGQFTLEKGVSEAATLVYTTTCHVVLSFLPSWDDEERLELIRLFLDYCTDFDAADSHGTTISVWANRMDRQVGEHVRREMAARMARKRGFALCS